MIIRSKIFYVLVLFAVASHELFWHLLLFRYVDVDKISVAITIVQFVFTAAFIYLYYLFENHHRNNVANKAVARAFTVLLLLYLIGAAIPFIVNVIMLLNFKVPDYVIAVIQIPFLVRIVPYLNPGLYLIILTIILLFISDRIKVTSKPKSWD